MEHFSITSTAKSYPRLPFQEMKEDIIGKQYNLSLAFIGALRATELNTLYRQKSYTPNVLSFPLDKANGEIYITPVVAKKEASKFNLSYRGYVGYLFIHGLLHLKGLDHGKKMDALEQRYITKYKLK